jgi:DNA repair exonuclease SbcCD nuclease subunit
VNKFIYCSDLHFGATPISRKDNYNEAILKKLIYIFQLARKNNCTILFGGDLVDTPKIKLYDLNNLMKVFIEFSDVPFYAIMGNEGHDGLTESSPITLLRMAKLVKGE